MPLPVVRSLTEQVTRHAWLRVRAGPNKGLRWSAMGGARGCVAGFFQEERIARLVALAPAGGFAWDIGAEEGYVTLALSRAVGAGGRVLAVEPPTGSLQVLRRHVGLNDIGNVTVLPEADPGALSLLLIESAGRTPDVLRLNLGAATEQALAGVAPALGPHTAAVIAVDAPDTFRAAAALLDAHGMRVLRSREIVEWEAGFGWSGDPDVVALGSSHALADADPARLRLA